MTTTHAAQHALRRFAGLLLLLGLITYALPTAAQFDGGGFGDLADFGPANASGGNKQVTVRLTTDTTAIVPGQSFTAALVFDIQPKWHLYWKNPEGPGKPVTVKWTLPEGYTVSDPIWPAPRHFSFENMTQFGYEDSLVFMFKITPPKDAAGDVALQAKVDWLACKTSCVPGKATLELSVPVNESAEASEDAGIIKQAQAEVPTTAEGWTVSAEKTDAGYTLTLQTPSEEAAASLKDLYFYSSVEYAVEPAADQVAKVDGKTVTLELKRRAEQAFNAGPVVFDPPLAGLTGVLTSSSGFGDDVKALKVQASFGLPEPTANEADAAASTLAEPGLGFAAAVGLAFVGGLILNLMPCVFPVLSIKILGFVQTAGEQPRIVRRHGYAFGLGVLISFWVLVSVLLVLRAALGNISWGFQLQNPTFVLAMLVLVFLIGLNLIGTFEIGIGLSGAAGKASQVAKDGYQKSFLTGVLATLIATPCTGPFMAPAIGYAIAAPSLTAFIVFTALGVGVAVPYVLLSCFPKLLNYLPKPGPWMESFKQAMAFPMFATAGWLAWTYIGVTSESFGLTVLIALSVMALGVWVYGKWSTPIRTKRTQWIARVVALVFVLGSITYVYFGAVSIKQARDAADAAREAGQYVYEWVDYSPQTIEQLQASGRPVLVDFTARWCFICQANKRSSLRIASSEKVYAQYNVALVEADYTREDPMIGKTLEKYERGGVPLYLVFPADGGEPEVLPNVLTPQIVEDAIKRAAGKQPAEDAALTSR